MAFVLLVDCLNLFILSGSALWSLVGPVFVPALMVMGMSPALSQAAFRGRGLRRRWPPFRLTSRGSCPG